MVVGHNRVMDKGKRCPNCGEKIGLKAKICRYCKYEFLLEPTLLDAAKIGAEWVGGFFKKESKN
jgi:predicted amidophosphoribosyltransferase